MGGKPMRIARYWDAAANTARYGIVEGDIIRELVGHPYREIIKTDNIRLLAATQLLAPCQPTKIIAGGANYRGHLKEVGLALPTVPVFFLKPPTTLVGPDQPVVYPPQTQKLEYEGELAVVVKSPMRNTPPGDVLKNLLGYTCVNDITARDWLRIACRGGGPPQGQACRQRAEDHSHRAIEGPQGPQ